MKFILFILLFSTGVYSFAQPGTFQIETKIVDFKNNPVSDVYIINFRNLDKNITLSNGIAKATVLPTDSLLINHISYLRKVVRVFDLLINPVVTLVPDTINLVEINVSPENKTDYERARENLAFLSEYKVPEFTKIKIEEPVSHQLMKEHNKILRSEAGSVSVVRFSPSEQFEKLLKNFKKKKNKNSP